MSLKDLAARVVPNARSCHLAHSSGIANAVICGLKFKLPNFMGATGRGDESYISGQIAHAALENSVDTIKDLWHPTVNSQRIIDTWRPFIDEIYRAVRQNAENDPSIRNVEHYIRQAEAKLHGVADVLQRRFAKEPTPSQIIPEITICNTSTRHEGRIDAIFEYPDHQETVEWKTYADGGVFPYDRFQTISNGMLVNYRYGRAEDDFNGNRLTIITTEEEYHPHPTPKSISSVRTAREYALAVLGGQRVEDNLPFYTVCQTCPYLDPCNFYKQTRQEYYNNKNNNQEKQLWHRRYKILEKRGSTHKNKFLLSNLTLLEVRLLGIADFGYQVDDIELSPSGSGMYTLTLRKIDETSNIGNSSYHHRLNYGDSVRVFAMEPNIPRLACRSVIGSIRRIEDDRLILDIYRGKPHQLQGFPILLLKTDVDLTKRELEAIDFVHRSASRIQSDIAFALLGEHRFDNNAPS